MELKERRDQFAYFLGYISKRKKQELHEAIKKHVALGYKYPEPKDAFEICPFNDSQEQIFYSLRILENSKCIDLPVEILRIVAEFVFLVSDFEPPCCYDGRTFYSLDSNQRIVLVCDRCENTFDLEKNEMKTGSFRAMEQDNFLALFGKETITSWPFHSQVKHLADRKQQNDG